jgi:hypothetical protein
MRNEIKVQFNEQMKKGEFQVGSNGVTIGFIKKQWDNAMQQTSIVFAIRPGVTFFTADEMLQVVCKIKEIQSEEILQNYIDEEMSREAEEGYSDIHSIM